MKVLPLKKADFRTDVAWTTCKMEAVNLHQLTHNPALGGTGR